MCGQDFDGYVAIELYIARQVDDPHSAPPDLALQGILSGEGGLKLEEFAGGLRHCTEFCCLWRKSERDELIPLLSKYFVTQRKKPIVVVRVNSGCAC